MSHTTCQAALFSSVGEPLRLRSFPIPRPVDGEALVRIEMCTICGSDLHTVQGKRQEPTPTILGHEAVGIVECVSNQPPLDIAGIPIQTGDRVTWSVVVSCSNCDRCQAGIPQKCRHLFKYGHSKAEGHYALSGGLAEYILLRSGSSLIKLPSALPDEVVCPANCAIATVAACFRQTGKIADQRVLIFGAGMLGLTAAAFADFHRASQVVIVDPNPSRLEKARWFGASCAVRWDPAVEKIADELHRNTGIADFDIVLELSGARAASQAALELGAIGAHIVLAGSVLPSANIGLDPQMLIRACWTLSGVHNYTPSDLKTAIDFLWHSRSRYPFSDLVEARFDLPDINRAVQFALENQPVRVAICPKSAS